MRPFAFGVVSNGMGFCWLHFFHLRMQSFRFALEEEGTAGWGEAVQGDAEQLWEDSLGDDILDLTGLQLAFGTQAICQAVCLSVHGGGPGRGVGQGALVAYTAALYRLMSSCQAFF